MCYQYELLEEYDYFTKITQQLFVRMKPLKIYVGQINNKNVI
jgi:hypothetical protein